MQIYMSLVVGDVSDDGIRDTISPDKEVIRVDLLEYYNDVVRDGGLNEAAPILPDDAEVETICQHIWDHEGRQVIVRESWLITP